jgi:hypothetical protein
MSKETDNARIRLLADALSKLAVGLFLGGLVVLLYSPLALLPRSLAVIVLTVSGILLYLAARHVIGKLKP